MSRSSTRALTAALLGALVALLLPAAAHATVAIQPAEVVETKPVTLTITGTAAAARQLHVARYDGHVPCSDRLWNSGGTSLDVAPGNAVPAGSWSRTAALEVPKAGPYTLCAYVGADMFAVADEVGRLEVTARIPTATIAFALPSDPMAERDQKITVSGTSEVLRDLDVAVLDGDVPCAVRPPTAIRDKLAYADIGPGAFSLDATLHRETPGVYTLCAWVTDFFLPGVNGAARQTITLREPRATVGVAGPATFTNLPKDTIGFTASGTLESSRQLWMIVTQEPRCAATPRAQQGNYIVAGEVLGSGPFAKRINGYGKLGRNTLCVFVGRETRPDATAAIGYTITLDPSLDEDAQAVPEPPVTPAALIAPVDLLRTKSLKPAFTWSAEGWKGEDTLVLASVGRDGKRTRLVDLGEERATVYHGKKRVRTTTAKLARVTTEGDHRTVRLKQPMPPGDYVWWVARGTVESGETVDLPSEQRRLTIEGERLRGRLVTKVRRDPGRFRAVPGSSTIGVRTAPYARVRFTVRGRAGAGAYSTVADADGLAFERITWTCAQPGARYDVTVRVADQYGAAKSRKVVTRGPSRARCARLLPGRLTKAAIRKGIRSATKQLTPKCAARGGVVVEVREPGGAYVDCRNPAGGYIVLG